MYAQSCTKLSLYWAYFVRHCFIDGFVHDCGNSSAHALELSRSCTKKPSVSSKYLMGHMVLMTLDCGNSIAGVLLLQQSCIKPPLYSSITSDTPWVRWVRMPAATQYKLITLSAVSPERPVSRAPTISTPRVPVAFTAYKTYGIRIPKCPGKCTDRQLSRVIKLSTQMSVFSPYQTCVSDPMLVSNRVHGNPRSGDSTGERTVDPTQGP